MIGNDKYGRTLGRITTLKETCGGYTKDINDLSQQLLENGVPPYTGRTALALV